MNSAQGLRSTALAERHLEDIDFSKLIRPHDTVMWTQGAGEPLGLLERLMNQRHAVGPFRVFLGAGYANTVRLEHTDVVTILGMGAVGSNKALCQAGKMEVIPCHLSDLPQLLANGTIKVDVVLMQLSAENPDGVFSVGGVNGYVQYALRQARVAIAEISASAPWTYSSTAIDMTRFDFVVRTARPLVEVRERSSSETDRRIAGNIANFVSDGAILQVGIGMIPKALLERVGDRRQLGLHAGVLGDAIIDLVENGALDNSTKIVNRGRSVTGALVGTRRLYDFAHRNTDLLVEPVTSTHNHEILRQIPGLIAVNSAIEVDLTGQVNSEIAGNSYAGTIGGQVDFVRGALAAEGGRSIIGLPSRTNKGAPRIVTRIASGVVTVARSDADVIATEYGVAELRGRSIADRVRAMIAIAHPDDREGLEREAQANLAGL